MKTKLDKTLNKMLRRHTELREWHLTSWQTDGHGGWKEQPVILIRGETPFYADHPQAYIDKLEEMSKDKTLFQGAFHALAGQLKDAMEQSWKKRNKK